MRSAIRFVVLLIFLNVLGMEQPPQPSGQPEQKMQISPAEFAQEGNRKESYLKLLPVDLRKEVAQKAFLNDFEKLDFAIAEIKTSAENNPEEKNRLLTDAKYNQQLIDQLSQAYRISQEEVAFMLNTPESIKILNRLEGYFKHGYYRSLQDIANTILEHYLKPLLGADWGMRQQNTMKAIQYLKRFLTHPLFRESRIYQLEEYLHHIDSIAHGETRFTTQFITCMPDIGRDPNDPLRNFDRFFLNRLHVFSRLLSYAIQLQNPLSLAWITEKIKMYNKFEPEPEKAPLLLANFLTYPLENAFNKRDTASILFLLQAMRDTRIQKESFTKIFNNSDLIDTLVEYVLGKSDLLVLERIKELTTETIFRNILNKLLKSMLFRQTLTQALMQKLLELGIDCNALYDDSYPLINAIETGNPAMVRLIIDIPGINVNICTSGGYNALWYVNNTKMDWPARQEINDLLKNAGATEEGSCAVQ